MRRAVAILAIRPSIIWMDLLSSFTEYDLYIVCDCNKEDYGAMWTATYPKIRFIQMPASEASDAGFSNLSTAVSPKQVVNAWDKAVYYFSKKQNYEHLWLIEEDVFFHHEKTIRDIDLLHKGDDLLSAPITSKNQDRASSWFWHWPAFTINLPEPHYRGMVCAIRVSRGLLGFIRQYAEKNKTLFFLEALFPTVARHYGLICSEPPELSTITYIREWQIEEIGRVNLYHPMKNLIEQRDARTIERFFSG
jgi:hypothetical protein